MVIKLKTYRGELLGTLIHQMETMQDRTSRNQERIRQIDKEIADLGAKNHIIAAECLTQRKQTRRCCEAK